MAAPTRSTRGADGRFAERVRVTKTGYLAVIAETATADDAGGRVAGRAAGGPADRARPRSRVCRRQPAHRVRRARDRRFRPAVAGAALHEGHRLGRELRVQGGRDPAGGDAVQRARLERPRVALARRAGPARTATCSSTARSRPMRGPATAARAPTRSSSRSRSSASPPATRSRCRRRSRSTRSASRC